METPMTIGVEQDPKILGGFRVIANDTSSRRPWCWYAPTLEEAQLLAKTICEETGEEVEISKYVGRVKRVKPATEYLESKQS